jgi:hypothetical protein
MRLYGKAILTDSLKESYLKNAVCDIPEYTFALMTDSHNGYKELRELLLCSTKEGTKPSFALLAILNRRVQSRRFNIARSKKP